MNNDYSWLGLYKRGIKLQWRMKNWEYFIPWQDVKDPITMVEYEQAIFRYKHSIQ